jgi:hypothetical protein
MPEYQTVLTEYRPKTVNKKDGSGSFIIHNFIDIQGRELTARQDVANIARGMLNQPLHVVTREEQKGNFLNVYLDFVGPAQGQQPVQNGGQQAITQAQAAQLQAQGPYYVQQPVQQQPQPIPPPTAPPQQVLSEKDRQIHRQVAAKVAAKISTTSNEFWRNAVDLAMYFDTGMLPTNPVQPNYPQQTQSYDSPPPHGDDSLPF